MTLRVISILARDGSDPWREAGRLAGLPPTAAVECLARLIAGMPQSPWSGTDAALIANRLALLLPQRSATGTVRAAASSMTLKAGSSWRPVQVALALLCLALVVGYALS